MLELASESGSCFTSLAFAGCMQTSASAQLFGLLYPLVAPARTAATGRCQIDLNKGLQAALSAYALQVLAQEQCCFLWQGCAIPASGSSSEQAICGLPSSTCCSSLLLPAADLVKEVVNPNAVIEFRENTADDPARRKPDITKVKTELGWEPKVALKDGLVMMIDDFKHRLGVE